MTKRLASPLHGILLIVLFSFSACYLAEMPVIKHLSLSPLIVGIVLGMLYANSLRNHLPKTWVPGILFCSKQVLRAGIVFYGFRLTFHDIGEVGWQGVLVDAVVVVSTILIGIGFGRLLKMDKDTALLTSVGSSICGAATVLGAEPVVKCQPYKAAVAVSTVVIFGTLSMFLYPALYRAGWFGMDAEQMGLYTGATLHEVAHVVGAGNAMSTVDAASASIEHMAIIVKMIRVMMLAPVLLVLAFCLGASPAGEPASGENGEAKESRRKIAVPWFAFLFVAAIAFNSLDWLPQAAVDGIEKIDTFMLTMAMTALGVETNIDKFKKAGAKPFVLALLLYAWLFFGGYWLVTWATVWEW